MSRRFVLVFLLSLSRLAYAQDCSPTSLADSLTARAAADQRARKALQSPSPTPEAIDVALRTDADNTGFMRRVLAACGWPKRSIVGADAAKAAWLLTQHADMDPQFQVLAAQQLKYAVLAKEADAWDLAVLVDRNRRLNDQPQVYGMQYASGPDGVITFYDIVNPGHLDVRRKAIGLSSFTCWATRVSKENGGAAIRWPEGVLFQTIACDAPH